MSTEQRADLRIIWYTSFMSRNKIILLIGILLVAMPFLGFPASWKNFFYILSGLIFIVMAVRSHMRRQNLEVLERHEVVTEVFVETSGSNRA